MALREESIQDQIESSKATYAKHKEAFEKWKIDNSKQVGTKEYEEYVLNFEKWGSEMQRNIEQLHAKQSSLDVVAVDTALGKLLDEASRQQFTEALLQVYQMDKTFTANVMANFKRIVDGNSAMPRLVNSTPVIAVQQQSYVPATAWSQGAAVKFRVPSPVSSYKKPGGSTMPFADFSK